MTDDLWNRRRELLVAQLQRAATALLEHTGAASFCVPWGDDNVLAGGKPESVHTLVFDATHPDDAESRGVYQRALLHPDVPDSVAEYSAQRLGFMDYERVKIAEGLRGDWQAFKAGAVWQRDRAKPEATDA